MTKGARVFNLEQLDILRRTKRSVVVPEFYPWRNPRPAAVIMHLQGDTLVRLFRSGMYVYEKEKR